MAFLAGLAMLVTAARPTGGRTPRNIASVGGAVTALGVPLLVSTIAAPVDAAAGIVATVLDHRER